MTNSKRVFAKAMGLTALTALALAVPVQSFAEGDDVVVRYMVPQWASSGDRRIERQIAFQSVIDGFNQADNGYVVEEVVTNVNQASIAQAIEEKAIDAVWINVKWYAALQSNGDLANLENYASNGELDEYFDWTIDALRSVDGNIGCVWHNTDTPLVFYDSTKIETPPTTWGEVRSIAEEQRSDGKYGMSYPIMHWSQFNMGMFNALGGEILDETGKPILFEGANRAKLVEMFSFYQSMFNDGLISAQNATSKHNDHLPMVYAGDTVMFLSNSNANIRALAPNLPPEEFGNWRAVPLPAPDGVDQGNYVAGGWFICPIAQDDTKVEAAAAAWALHATDAPALRDTNKAGGWLPTRGDVFQMDQHFQNDIFLQTANKALEDGGWAAPFSPIYPVIDSALNTAMSAVGSGQATIEEALDAAEADVMRQYEAL